MTAASDRAVEAWPPAPCAGFARLALQASLTRVPACVRPDWGRTENVYPCKEGVGNLHFQLCIWK